MEMRLRLMLAYRPAFLVVQAAYKQASVVEASVYSSALRAGQAVYMMLAQGQADEVLADFAGAAVQCGMLKLHTLDRRTRPL
jgi:hypothetical protein